MGRQISLSHLADRLSVPKGVSTDQDRYIIVECNIRVPYPIGELDELSIMTVNTYNLKVFFFCKFKPFKLIYTN